MSDLFTAGLPIGSSSTTFTLNGVSGGSAASPLNISSVSNAVSSATSAVQSAVSSASSISNNLINSSVSSATSQLTSLLGTSGVTTGTSTVTGSGSDVVDFRVRIRPQINSQTQVYGAKGTSNLLNILYDTNGMLFPYTPNISWNQNVDYDPLHFTHSNQDYYAYKSTPSTKIDISGQWSLQNQREGEYMIASMHFLRTVSKMYFGQSNPTLAGMPPPVLLLSGYGDFMFNDLPVIVMSHSYTLDNTVDYVTIQVAGGKVRLPSLINISVSLVVQHTPKAMRTQFDLDKFRTGALMRTKGWI